METYWHESCCIRGRDRFPAKLTTRRSTWNLISDIRTSQWKPSSKNQAQLAQHPQLMRNAPTRRESSYANPLSATTYGDRPDAQHTPENRGGGARCASLPCAARNCARTRAVMLRAISPSSRPTSGNSPLKAHGSPLPARWRKNHPQAGIAGSTQGSSKVRPRSVQGLSKVRPGLENPRKTGEIDSV
jgi:hypothetical protein